MNSPRWLYRVITIGLAGWLLTAPTAGALGQTTAEASAQALDESASVPLAGAIPPDQAELLALDPVQRQQPINVFAGLDLVTRYVSRGLVFSDEFSFQPWVELDVPAPEEVPTGPFDSLSVFVGNWNSLHDGSNLGRARTANRETLEAWYEADLYAGFRATFAKHWGASLRFNYYTSPSNSFQDIHEVDARITYDDVHLWADRLPGFTLKPRLRIAKETRDGGGPEGWYFEPSLRPSYTFESLPLPVTVQVPLVVGFGAHGQYRDADGKNIPFGFFQSGLSLSGPLEVLPEGMGTLHWQTGADVIVVSDSDLGFKGDQVLVVGRFGLSWAY